MVEFGKLLLQIIGATIGGVIGAGLAFWIGAWLGETVGTARGEGVVIAGFASTLPGAVMGSALAVRGVASILKGEGSFWIALAGAVVCALVFVNGGNRLFGGGNDLYGLWVGLALLTGIGAMLGFNLPNVRKRE